MMNILNVSSKYVIEWELNKKIWNQRLSKYKYKKRLLRRRFEKYEQYCSITTNKCWKTLL